MKCMYCDGEKEAVGFLYKEGTFGMPACQECYDEHAEEIELEFEDVN